VSNSACCCCCSCQTDAGAPAARGAPALLLLLVLLLVQVLLRLTQLSEHLSATQSLPAAIATPARRHATGTDQEVVAGVHMQHNQDCRCVVRRCMQTMVLLLPSADAVASKYGAETVW
jgi:MYXO-CTERM domain-containing protein